MLWKREKADEGSWDLECAGYDIKQSREGALGSQIGRGRLRQDLKQERKQVKRISGGNGVQAEGPPQQRP